jgi:hypothetical protein
MKKEGACTLEIDTGDREAWELGLDIVGTWIK